MPAPRTQFPVLILSLGVPRSGTILVFNILREILERRRIGHKAVNLNYPETAAFFERYDFNRRTVVHAHNVLPPVQKALTRRDVVAFFNYRDPRDVLVSMMRLHDCSFEKALELTETSFQQFRVARKFRRVTFIPYEHLTGHTDAFIFQIAQRLGIFLGLDTVAEIGAATSLETHTKIMHDVAEEAVDVQVRRNPHRVLKESRRHFINDRHIQSGRSGRWRDELTEARQQAACERFRPLLEELGMAS